MSDYVEASYALVVLTQARCLQPGAARELMASFLRDCTVRTLPGHGTRREALVSICRLRDSLSQGCVPDQPAWHVAFSATRRWQNMG